MILDFIVGIFDARNYICKLETERNIKTEISVCEYIHICNFARLYHNT